MEVIWDIFAVLNIETFPDVLRHRPIPRVIPRQKVQDPRAIPPQEGFPSHHEELAGARERGGH